MGNILITLTGILSYGPNLVLLGLLFLIILVLFIKALKPEITFGPYDARECKRKQRQSE